MTTPSSNSNGWVALSTRKPTKEDADKSRERVLFYDALIGPRMLIWDQIEPQFTHWMRLPPPPESEEQKRARLDEEAMQAAWKPENIGGDTGRYANFCKGFRAGIAHARQPEAHP